MIDPKGTSLSASGDGTVKAFFQHSGSCKRPQLQFCPCEIHCTRLPLQAGGPHLYWRAWDRSLLSGEDCPCADSGDSMPVLPQSQRPCMCAVAVYPRQIHSIQDRGDRLETSLCLVLFSPDLTGSLTAALAKGWAREVMGSRL